MVVSTTQVARSIWAGRRCQDTRSHVNACVSLASVASRGVGSLVFNVRGNTPADEVGRWDYVMKETRKYVLLSLPEQGCFRRHGIAA